MKFLLIILSLISLNIAHTLPNDSTIKNLSFDQKKLLFDQHKEFPIFMIFLNSVPTLGYSRIHKFNRGITIYCTQFLLSYLYFRYSYSRNLVDFDTSSPEDILIGLYGLETIPEMFNLWAGFKILESIDLYIQTNKYNKQLHNKIFGKKDNNLSFKILPTSNGAYLNLSYKF